MRDTDRDWTKIAEEEPYWGILSSEEFRGRELSPEMREKFFSEGEGFVSELFAQIKRQLPDFRPSRSLDFGCGVGRLLIPIARRSTEAVGIDIAPKMLELATFNIKNAGLTNTSLVASDDNLSMVSGEFDFIHSYIVLQHIPLERGYIYFRRLLGLLVLGGVFAIQFTFGKRRDLMVHEGPRARYYRRDGGLLHDLGQTSHELPAGTVNMFDYDLNQVFAIAGEFTSSPISVTLRSEAHLSLYLVGRRTLP